LPALLLALVPGCKGADGDECAKPEDCGRGLNCFQGDLGLRCRTPAWRDEYLHRIEYERLAEARRIEEEARAEKAREAEEHRRRIEQIIEDNRKRWVDPARFVELRAAGQRLLEDRMTSLVWQGDEYLSSDTHGAGVVFCEELTYGEKDDWRMPTVFELGSIADHTGAGVPRFPASAEGTFWTTLPVNGINTISGELSLASWFAFVRFERGYADLDQPFRHHATRCVRGKHNPDSPCLEEFRGQACDVINARGSVSKWYVSAENRWMISHAA
jgi:hypothetical protein